MHLDNSSCSLFKNVDTALSHKDIIFSEKSLSEPSPALRQPLTNREALIPLGPQVFVPERFKAR